MPIKKKSNTDSLFLSFENADQQIYGATGESQREGKAVESISIFDITPDPMQPRRAMPSAVREAWNGDSQQLKSVFDYWGELIESERGGEFPLQKLFEQASKSVVDQNGEDNDNLHAEQPGPFEASFMTILNLAASIQRDGLLNPITVAPRQGGGYQLETGERRWLAHHLLNILVDHTRFLNIDVIINPDVNVWRQAAENNARADLNAIGKARQFAILLMDLLRREGQTFQPMSAFDNERDFYAQVADGEQFRIPRGKGEMLLNAIGLKNGRQLRDYRRLLSLPDEVWQLADDYNWAEGRLRTLDEQAHNDEELIQLAKEMVDTVPIGTVSSENAPSTDAVSAKSTAKKDDWLDTKQQRQHISELLKVMNRILGGDIEQETIDEAFQLLSDQRAWINQIETMLAQLVNEKEKPKRNR